MAETFAIVQLVAAAPNWDSRVALIRRVPEEYGTARHQMVYAAIAEQVYVPSLTPDFGYVHWRPEYELDAIEAAYEEARAATAGFHGVSRGQLARAIRHHPRALRVFRLLLGLTGAEFAEATSMAGAQHGLTPVSKAAVANIEGGMTPTPSAAEVCAAVIDLVMAGQLFPPGTGSLRSKVDKPDTAAGWTSVQQLAIKGVPLPVLLHQRAYGGAFRQLLDATSNRRGNVLETPVEELFQTSGIPYVRTGSHNQADIEARFGLTVKPAPDFVVFDSRTDTVRAMLECKAANDGGTARDKAARFARLRTESNRLGGVPLFAVLAGIGWRRTNDALGPVVRDTDGRVFAIATLPEMLTTDPFPSLFGLVTR